MSLKLYNTLSRRKEEFVPADPDRVTMYVCGPTVYNLVHIGNARPIVVFDVLYRLLRETWPGVVYARNITDIDDKINTAARDNGEPIAALTARYTEAFHQDIARLNTLPPDIEPRATDHVDAIIDLIRRLVDQGHAYEADGHVLFHVPSMADYGRLSGRNREDLIAGARVEVAPYKRDPADFVLWKPSSEDLPGWDSPWGRGRPGWHIECSAMAKVHLADTIDIHGGGQDLIFPHHENEIAQSCCAHGGIPLARYWVHNGYITVAGDKMAKSAGNFSTLRDLLATHPGEVIRLALLTAHYRQPLDWSADAIDQAQTTLDRFYQALRNAGDVDADTHAPPPDAVRAALEDDLNTPLALRHLHEAATALNKAVDTTDRRRRKGELLAGAGLLGVLAEDPEDWFRNAGAAGPDAETIEALIAERARARANRDFARADEIRDSLADQGVILEDNADGTSWRRLAGDRATADGTA